MSNFFISTTAISSPTRSVVFKLQAELARAQTELSSGKLSDAGLQLGGAVADLGKMRQSQAWQDALTSTNSIAASRLDMSQTALTGISDSAQNFLDQLLGASGSVGNASSVVATARNSLAAMTEQVNTQVAGVYVFGGNNSAEAPLASFGATGSAASQAIATAFTTAFGFAPDDPAVSNITPSQIQAFLDGPFAAEFSDTNWSANWSKASSVNPTMQIANDQLIETGANANEQPIRKLAQAYVMISSLGTDKLNASTLSVVLGRASSLTSNAMTGITGIQSRLGSVQQQITGANDSISAEGQIISARLTKMEGVDPYAASTTVNNIMTQLEASYAVTARLQKLSILNYL